MSTELAKLRRIVERADLATAIIEMDGAFATSAEVHYAPGRECSADQRRPSNSLAGFNLIGEWLWEPESMPIIASTMEVSR